MLTGNINLFEKAFKEVLGFEGGYSDHSADRGGKTKYGITLKVARNHGYRGRMKDLSLEEAKSIYKKSYWDKQKLDKVGALSPLVAMEMFESGVNFGTSIPSRFLQRALNLLNRNGKNYQDLVVDGVIGRKTLGALTRVKNTGPQGVQTLHKIMNTLQGQRYIDIMERSKSQEVFARGWFKRVNLA